MAIKQASKTTKSKSAKAGKSESNPEVYQRTLARSRIYAMNLSRLGRDVAPAPEIVDRERRDRAFASLEIFLRCYFPLTFTLPWCADHHLVIDRLQTAIEHGGLFAVAMPRGQGKSSIVERSALWAILSGRRKFCGIVAANEKLAEKSLAKIKAELERNPLLLEDFPKIMHPIHALESQARRCVGQLYDGERTRITWQRKELVLPSMPPPDNEGSGSAIITSGITSAVRGLSYVDDLGATIRPDLVLCDDPQDRESSRSVVQTSERLSILRGDLIGMAGPGKRITCVVPCTVINTGDLADQLLDAEKSPDWNGVRCKLIYAWPDQLALWDEYLSLRREGLRPGGDPAVSTAFYSERREIMDAGGVAAWPERFEPGEISAIQHAFNLRAKIGEHAFMSEYQNSPVVEAKLQDALDPVAIASRCNGFAKGVAPPEAEKITGMIDCGQTLLWWMTCAWDESFGCTILDYGCWPEQRVRMFLSRNASPSLEQVYPGGAEAAVFAGLTSLVARLFGHEWKRSDGATLPLSRVLIDSGWNMDLIRRFIRGSQYREKLTPSRGVGISATKAPIAEWPRRMGEKRGESWILGAAGKDQLRTCQFDANVWKSRVASMLTRPLGLKGGVVLFGDKPVAHELLAMHLTSETSTLMEANGRKANVWDRRADAENHLWDCLTGNAVAASLEGLSPLASLGGGKPVEPKKRQSFAEAYAAKWGSIHAR